MSAKPASMDGYIRVSRVAGRAGDSFISPAVQRERIEAWAKSRGVEIAAWHEDLDQSGGKLDRPGLTALLERIETGESGGVAVAKLDRLSRLGVGDALKLVEQITERGGTLATADGEIDLTTNGGKFQLTVLLALAEMERERLKDGWGEAKGRAVDRGVFIGPTPIGYVKLEDGTLAPCGDTAPIITATYRVAAADGLDAAHEHLKAAIPGRRWTAWHTRDLLAKRTYLGELHYGDMLYTDEALAIIDRATWEAAQHPARKARRANGNYPLSGIATCGTCGAAMVGTKAGDGRRAYRCRANVNTHKGERCPGAVNVTAELLERYVIDHLKAALDGDTLTIGGDTPDGLAEAEAALLDAEAELQAFAADLQARKALGATYGTHLQARSDAVTSAQAAYRALAGASAKAVTVVSADLLDTDDPVELRLQLSAALQAVIVNKGRTPLAGRVRIVHHGEAGVPTAQ